VRRLAEEAPQLKGLNGDEPGPVRLLRARGKKGEWHFCAVPEKGWPNGLSTLTFSATDNSGNNSTSQGWLLNSPKPENGVVINANGRYEENGKPIFPYGIYQVEKDEDMAELRSLGFNAVHTYFWEHSRDDDACRGYLDRCWAADGLRAFVGFDRKAILNDEIQVIAHRVGTIADHPGLFVYYLFDEPEDPNQYVSASQMNRFADLIRGLDPYHAVVLTTWNPSMINYRSTWDTHWSQAYGTPGYVVGLLDDHKRFLNNASPITLLLHCYDYAQMAEYRATGKYDVNAFSPDCDWMRCAAWTGICQDVNGLWWWWFCKNDENWLTAPTVPEIWKGFCGMMRELCSYQEFLESDKMSYGRLSVDHQLVVWGVKRTADRELLIVANTSDKPVDVTLPAETGHPQTLTLGRYGVSLQVFPR
ncbi:MAG: hypothetical protein MJ106_05895, partial [Lentisphaeria bacterium]|nr:hypothetical protein [Lentisphaeria bacterium]